MCKYTNKFIIFLSIIIITIALNSCTNYTSPQPQNNNDDSLIKVAYSGYKVPDNFYSDLPFKENTIYYSVFYYNGDFYYPEEYVCTNNKNDAQNKVASYINFRGWGDSPTFTNISENEKFFEFISLKSLYNNNTYYNVYRVVKCDYLQEMQFFAFDYDDLLGSPPGTYIGKFMKKPITKENVNELIEFLWYSYLINYRMDGSKIINTSINENGNSINKTFYETTLIVADWGGCDQITLHKTVFSVNKITGNITLAFHEVIRTSSGKCH